MKVINHYILDLKVFIPFSPSSLIPTATSFCPDEDFRLRKVSVHLDGSSNRAFVLFESSKECAIDDCANGNGEEFFTKMDCVRITNL